MSKSRLKIPPKRIVPPVQPFLDRSRIKPYSVRHPKPSDWGYGMTVCIAALAQTGYGDFFVTASDEMLSLSEGAITGDGMTVKGNTLGRHWHVMASGNSSEYSIIIRRIKNSLWTSIEDWRSKRHSLEEIAAAVNVAYKGRVQERIQAEILDPYGLKLGEFDVQENVDIRSRIDWLVSKEFDCQLLVYGFDWSKDVPIPEFDLFSVRPPGETSFHDATLFWAIGNGAELAINSLVFSSQNYPNSSLEQTIWNVCVAKFRAERAHGVGEKTDVTITGHNLAPHWVDEELIIALRKEWVRLEERNRQCPRIVKPYVNQYVKTPTAEYFDEPPNTLE